MGKRSGGILGKVHIHRSRDNTIVPGISPITPVKGSAAPNIIDDAPKEVDLPPSCRRARPVGARHAVAVAGCTGAQWRQAVVGDV